MDSNNPSQKRTMKHSLQKRRWLASLINLGAGVSIALANGAVMADNSASTAPHPSRSPIGTTNKVRSNPFVIPTAVLTTASMTPMPGEIAQTSDLQMSQVRLKSIGTAVGLVPIGAPASYPSADRTVLEVTQPSVSRIRMNPLAGSETWALEEPVQEEPVQEESVQDERTQIESTQEDFALEEPVQGDVMKVIPNETTFGEQSEARIVAYQPSPSANTKADCVCVKECVSIDDSSSAAPAPFSTDVAPSPEPTAKATVETEDSFESGVEFSMSDLDSPSPTRTSETAKPLTPVQSSVVSKPAKFAPPKRDESPVKVQLEIAQLKQRDLPDAMADAGNVAGFDLQKLPLLPTPHPSWIAPITEESNSLAGANSTPQRVNIETVDRTEKSKFVQRYRPHVEIAAPPMLTFEKQKRANSVNAARIIPAKFATPVKPEAESAAVPAAVQPRPTKQASMAVDPRIAAMNETVELIRDSYSATNVSLFSQGKKLVVRGVCRDREQATEIIRLVRNKHLIPVDDQLVIR